MIWLAALGVFGVLVCTPALSAPSRRVAVFVAKVYPSADAAAIDDAVILIKGDRIEKVGPRKAMRVPPGYQLIEQTGGVATAGFWNSHVHLLTPALLKGSAAGDSELQQELEGDFTRGGFTTVFDLASTMGFANAVRQRIEKGAVVGPRVLTVGAPFYPKGNTPIYARPFYRALNLPSAEVTSDASAASRVQRQAEEGADGVKLFTGSIIGEHEVAYMPAATIATISRAARRVRQPVFAHPTDRTGLELAVGNGANILAHSAPLMGEWSARYARWIVSKRVAMIPTLSLFEVQPHPSTPVSVAVQQTRALHRAGGTILFGTDAGFTDAFDTSAELRLLGQAIGWRGVFASLTTGPAKVFGEARLRGRIAPGYVADIVVVDGDPAVEVENLAKVRLVMRSGRSIFTR